MKATSTQVAKSAGIISKARKYLNKETLLMLYYAFIPLAHIDYGILIWGASNLKYFLNEFNANANLYIEFEMFKVLK